MSHLNCVVREVSEAEIDIALLLRFFAEEGFSGTAETIAINTRRARADPHHGSPWHAATARLSGSSRSRRCSTSSGAALGRSVTCMATRGAAQWCRDCVGRSSQGQVPRTRLFRCIGNDRTGRRGGAQPYEFLSAARFRWPGSKCSHPHFDLIRAAGFQIGAVERGI
jgi:hypothetical protein